VQVQFVNSTVKKSFNLHTKDHDTAKLLALKFIRDNYIQNLDSCVAQADMDRVLERLFPDNRDSLHKHFHEREFGDQ